MTKLAVQLRIWSVSSTVAWVIGASIVMILNLIFGQGGTWVDPIVILGMIMAWIKIKYSVALSQLAVTQ